MLFNRISPEDMDLFKEVMSKECLIRKEWQFNFFDQHRPSHIFQDAIQLLEIARSSTIPRVFLKDYGLCAEERTHESVGSHTNLFKTLFARALDDFEYCTSTLDNTGNTKKIIIDEIDQYSREEMYEAITLHDLPENVYGDWPDNDSCDLYLKHQQETSYFTDFAKLYMRKGPDFGKHVLELLQAMDNRNSLIGQLLYLADKTSAIITALSYDSFGKSPMMEINNPNASQRDRLEMGLCDYQKNGRCKASEMWSIDFFEIRQLCQYDRTGYYTAIIVMCTIMIHRQWYYWRIKAYADYHHRLDNP